MVDRIRTCMFYTPKEKHSRPYLHAFYGGTSDLSSSYWWNMPKTMAPSTGPLLTPQGNPTRPGPFVAMVSRELDGPTLARYWQAAVWYSHPTHKAGSTVGAVPGRHPDAPMAP